MCLRGLILDSKSEETMPAAGNGGTGEKGGMRGLPTSEDSSSQGGINKDENASSSAVCMSAAILTSTDKVDGSTAANSGSSQGPPTKGVKETSSMATVPFGIAAAMTMAVAGMPSVVSPTTAPAEAPTGASTGVTSTIASPVSDAASIAMSVAAGERICLVCKKDIGRKRTLDCSVCRKASHARCVNVWGAETPKSWVCRGCRESSPDGTRNGEIGEEKETEMVTLPARGPQNSECETVSTDRRCPEQPDLLGELLHNESSSLTQAILTDSSKASSSRSDGKVSGLNDGGRSRGTGDDCLEDEAPAGHTESEQGNSVLGRCSTKTGGTAAEVAVAMQGEKLVSSRIRITPPAPGVAAAPSLPPSPSSTERGNSKEGAVARPLPPFDSPPQFGRPPTLPGFESYSSPHSRHPSGSDVKTSLTVPFLPAPSALLLPFFPPSEPRSVSAVRGMSVPSSLEMVPLGKLKSSGKTLATSAAASQLGGTKGTGSRAPEAGGKSFLFSKQEQKGMAEANSGGKLSKGKLRAGAQMVSTKLKSKSVTRPKSQKKTQLGKASGGVDLSKKHLSSPSRPRQGGNKYNLKNIIASIAERRVSAVSATGPCTPGSSSDARSRTVDSRGSRTPSSQPPSLVRSGSSSDNSSAQTRTPEGSKQPPRPRRLFHWGPRSTGDSNGNAANLGTSVEHAIRGAEAAATPSRSGCQSALGSPTSATVGDFVSVTATTAVPDCPAPASAAITAAVASVAATLPPSATAAPAPSAPKQLVEGDEANGGTLIGPTSRDVSPPSSQAAGGEKSGPEAGDLADVSRSAMMSQPPSSIAAYPPGTIVVVHSLDVDPGRTLKFARNETYEVAFKELVGREGKVVGPPPPSRKGFRYHLIEYQPWEGGPTKPFTWNVKMSALDVVRWPPPQSPSSPGNENKRRNDKVLKSAAAEMERVEAAVPEEHEGGASSAGNQGARGETEESGCARTSVNSFLTRVLARENVEEGRRQEGRGGGEMNSCRERGGQAQKSPPAQLPLPVYSPLQTSGGLDRESFLGERVPTTSVLYPRRGEMRKSRRALHLTARPVLMPMMAIMTMPSLMALGKEQACEGGRYDNGGDHCPSAGVAFPPPMGATAGVGDRPFAFTPPPLEGLGGGYPHASPYQVPSDPKAPGWGDSHPYAAATAPIHP